MEKEITTNFSINNVLNKKNIKIDEDTNILNTLSYKKAERIVKDKVINQKGSQEESDRYNEILSKCILGDATSIVQMKEFIKQYLLEANEFSKEEIENYTEYIYIYNFGLSVIDDLVKDDSINEIWVNGKDHIWIEKDGKKIRLNRKFRSNEEIIRVMRQMLQFDKKEINKSNPTAESKLLDGSRITFAISPVSSYPCIDIRKFKAFVATEENLLENKTTNKEQLELLKILIQGRSNILIIGETGSGKTSFLSFLCDFINENLRIGTVESNFELKLSERYPKRNIFEYEEHDEIGRTLGELFKLCLRSCPDIIFLGEARGSEEAELLINSMRRGHPGSIGTLHTNNSETAIDDVVDMIIEDGTKKRDPLLLRGRVSSAIDIIIQIHRFEDGKRRIARITEVESPEGLNYKGEYKLNDLSEYDRDSSSFVCKGGIKGTSLKKKLKFFGVSEEDIKKISENEGSETELWV